MRAAHQQTSNDAPAQRWTEICERYPDEWVCLVDVDDLQDGLIGSARVVGHDHSMKNALAQLGITTPGTVVVHTGARSLRFPRIEMADEIRDVVRARR